MSNNNDSAVLLEKKAERIARYKEERRKQLQAQRHHAANSGGGGVDSSSSEDLPAAHEETSYAKYKHRKQLQRQQMETRVETTSDAANSNVEVSGIKRFIKRESPLLVSEDTTGNSAPSQVRTNRAARLRAAAASGTPPPPVDDKLAGVLRSKRLSVPSLDVQQIATSDSAAPSADAIVASDGQIEPVSGGGVAGQVVLRQKAPSGASRVKDKSTKRKSNLNRALTDEQVVGSGPNESQDDSGKRIRRRRPGDSNISPSSADTDLSSSVDNSAMRRPSSEITTPTDLRSNLRKTSQPPSFIRPANGSPLAVPQKEKSPSPSVPWRTSGKAAVIKTEDLTARIEALTAMASQTVAKVDRLTTSDNGAHPNLAAVAGSGGVKAVASKLLNRAVVPTAPARRPSKVDPPAVAFVGSKPAAPQQAPLKNRLAAFNDKTPANHKSADESSVRAVQGILKKKVDGQEVSSFPILRVEDDPVSILKRRCSRDESALVKRPASGEGSAESSRSLSPDPLNSILKRTAAPPGGVVQQAVDPAGSDPRPILKKRSSAEDPGLYVPVSDGPRPILKKKSSTDDEHEPADSKPKPILKSIRRTSCEQLDVDRQRRSLESAQLPPPVPVPAVSEQEPEEPRQLSVAERISSLQQNVTAAAPWRLPSRPVNGTADAVPKRRKSLDVHQAAESNPIEAVNHHVTPNGNSTKPETEEVKQEETVVAEDGSDTETGSSGLDRIRGILRRKSSESFTGMKGILRSKSPSAQEEQPKSILKRHNPEEEVSSSSSEDLIVSAENDLAAKMLNVELEAKNNPPEAPSTPPLEKSSPSHSAVSNGSVVDVPAPSSEQQVAEVKRETIVLESEGSSSETTTTVTFRLGGTSVVQQSQTKTTSKKATVMEDLTGTSLATRLASLQKSGESEWRKRVTTSEPAEVAETDKGGIAERLKVLETAQQGWKMRVHEPDAARFTVAGKMGQRPVSVHVLASPSDSGTDKPASPLIERKKKKAPKPVPLRVKAAATSAESSPGTPSTDDGKPCYNRSTSDPSGTPKTIGPIIKPVKVTSRVVSVPRPDDETFTSFFASSTWSLSSQSVTTMVASSFSAEDFDHIASSRNLMVEKRSVNVQRRKNASRNPIKSLILRASEICRDEYEEVDTGVAEREVQRIKLEQLAKGSHLAVEALAGLASKEDFSLVALKAAKDSAEEAVQAVYLLQIKGRRYVQCRLVEPTYKSVNSGDCYVLVTPTDVIQFVGRYSNVIERARSADVAQRILFKKDLGCARASQVLAVEEEKVGCNAIYGASKRFWNALGRTEAGQEILPAGPPEEDELYETAIVATNTVWLFNDKDQLLPYDDHWGSVLQIDMLDPNKVMVFDFGSEMYVWSGKMAPLEARKKAMELAKELWNGGYDYSECAINPVAQRVTPAEQNKAEKRPEWAVLRSAKEHMEPILFREKFIDWPHVSGVIKVKRQESDEKAKSATPLNGTSPPRVTDISSLTACDAQLVLDNKLEDPDLELEGSHLGRGVEFYDEAERRLHQISTLSVRVWHLLDYEKVQLDDVSRGQFHSRDTYIIRWQYRITVTGKDLKGQPSVHGLLGRDRFCYFIWHGAQAPPTDQGASALKTVELDEERGPHVRVQQGHEPPAFLALFQGRMAVHSGKRGESGSDDGWRLYFVRGEKDGEAHLLQVRRSVQALRSRGCLLLVNQSTGTVFLWNGAKSLKHSRQVAAFTAAALRQHRPPEFGFQATPAVKEQFEGAESREFWEGLGHNSRVADRSLYLSLADSPKSSRFDYTPRLFHLTSWTGQFRVEEVAPSSRCPAIPCPYPFLQEDVYGANQPTLFMLDNDEEVWLWQGWWPEQPDTDNTNTGSSKLRWTAERRCAMETVVDYCRLKRQDRSCPPSAYLISAGLEPLAFTALFPDWTVDERVGQLNIQDGRKEAGESESIEEVLDRLRRTTYSLGELQVRPPPEGVDPTRLESYLTAEDFQETLGMAKPEFYALPAWKQSQLRKEAGLF